MRIQTRYAVLPACGLIVGALMGVSLHFDNIDGKKFEEALFMQMVDKELTKQAEEKLKKP